MLDRMTSSELAEQMAYDLVEADGRAPAPAVNRPLPTSAQLAAKIERFFPAAE